MGFGDRQLKSRESGKMQKRKTEAEQHPPTRWPESFPAAHIHALGTHARLPRLRRAASTNNIDYATRGMMCLLWLLLLWLLLLSVGQMMMMMTVCTTTATMVGHRISHRPGSICLLAAWPHHTTAAAALANLVVAKRRRLVSFTPGSLTCRIHDAPRLRWPVSGI